MEWVDKDFQRGISDRIRAIFLMNCFDLDLTLVRAGTHRTVCI